MGHISSRFWELPASLGLAGKALPNGGAAETWLCWPQQEGLAKLPPLSLSCLSCHSSEHKFGVNILYVCWTCLVPGLTCFSCLQTLGLV